MVRGHREADGSAVHAPTEICYSQCRMTGPATPCDTIQEPPHMAMAPRTGIIGTRRRWHLDDLSRRWFQSGGLDCRHQFQRVTLLIRHDEEGRLLCLHDYAPFCSMSRLRRACFWRIGAFTSSVR